jgi:hypothetical protein
MKKIIFAALLLTSIYSCSIEKNDIIDNIEEIPVVTIATSILIPTRDRDYSYHNNGVNGVFEDPTLRKNFKAKIVFTNNSYTSNDSLTVKWISDIDGQLYEGNPNTNFESEINVNLSKGLHKISFEVYSNNTLTDKDSVYISNVIKLEGLAESGRSVELKWSKYEGNDFVSYLVYGENFQPLFQINDINTLEYEYFEAISMIENREYQIVVKTVNSTNDLINASNIISLKSGIFAEIPYYISKIINDEMNGRIYGIINPRNNSANAGLVVFDNESLDLLSHILQSKSFSDIDISPDGQFLYLTQKYAEELTKINLNSMSIETFPTSTDNRGFHKIEAGNNNLLFCHITPPTSGWTAIHIFNAQNGNELNISSYTYRHGDLKFNPANEALYHGESNTSSGRLSKNTFVNDTLNFDFAYPPFNGPGINSPYPYLFLSYDYNSLFWENFQFDADLNVIRQFYTNMISCSPSNIYLSDLQYVYDYESVDVIFSYPPFPHNDYTRTLLFIDDNTIITSKAYRPNVISDPNITYLFKMKIK